jgi:1A family penicillin-binding protein
MGFSGGGQALARTREARKKARGTSLGGRLRSLRPRDAALLVVKAGAFSVLVLTLVFFCLVLLLPLPESPVPQATQVFDANGRPVSSLFVQNRTVVPSGDIPNALKQGTVAVEDKRFYEHPGIDLESLARALVRDLKARAYVEGGSTVTMQLARNLFLTEEKTLHRKFIESVYTLKLEMRYTKDEILTMYLNQIYFGHGTWGCEVASETYFGKHVKDLTLAECAMVAGIIRSPENYSPYNDAALAVSRRSLVLGLMADQGYISPEERDAAEKAPVLLAGLPKSAAPYFVAYVISQLESRHPEIGDQIYRGGYRIYTTLDLDMQKAAEEAFARHMPEGAKDAQGVAQPQGALVALEPSTGYVKAMIGGRDWDETQLNRACQVKRQPGSAFKIFLYAAVLDRRHAVTETKVCEPVTYPGAATGERYRPVDFGRQPYHYAPLDIRQAVAVSDNVVATKWAQEIGPETIIDYARRLGVKSPLEASIPLALGASEVVPLDMAVAAATLAAGGIRPEPVSILKVVDAMGQVIEENRVKRTPALDAGTAYVLTSVLRSVLGPYGTGAGLGAWLGSRPAAGKTGTTDGQLEAWFVGYTRELACTVYVGWDHREKSLPGTGGAVAGPIWADFVGTALRDVPVKDWTAPPNVTWTEVCDDTNLLAGPGCPSRHYEVFLKDALPPVDTAPAERHPRKQTAGTAESGTLSGVPPVRPMETFPLPPGGPPQIPR